MYPRSRKPEGMSIGFQRGAIHGTRLAGHSASNPSLHVVGSPHRTCDFSTSAFDASGGSALRANQVASTRGVIDLDFSCCLRPVPPSWGPDASGYAGTP